MNIIDVTRVCSDPALGNVLSTIKNFINIIQIVGPILAIVALVVLIIKLMMNPDEKKIPKQIRNCLIALAVLFFIPMMINVVMSYLGESFSLSACWNDSKKQGTTSNYINPYTDKDKTKIVTDSSYDKGDEKKEDNTNTNTNTNTTTLNKTIGKRYFIGDSRTVQMYCYLHNDWNSTTVTNLSSGLSEDNGDVWSSKGAMGLDWMKSTGIPNVEANFKSGTAVIILMGVNDLYNVDNYINYLNSKVNAWKSKGASVYFVSVNPTSGNYSNLNSRINSFNDKIKTISGIKYIDTNNYLVRNGFTATDGLHYDKATYQKIYNYILSNL